MVAVSYCESLISSLPISTTTSCSTDCCTNNQIGYWKSHTLLHWFLILVLDIGIKPWWKRQQNYKSATFTGLKILSNISYWKIRKYRIGATLLMITVLCSTIDNILINIRVLCTRLLLHSDYGLVHGDVTILTLLPLVAGAGTNNSPLSWGGLSSCRTKGVVSALPPVNCLVPAECMAVKFTNVQQAKHTLSSFFAHLWWYFW